MQLRKQMAAACASRAVGRVDRARAIPAVQAGGRRTGRTTPHAAGSAAQRGTRTAADP